MRKLFNLFAAALVMLAAASCEKNEVFPDNTTNGKVVTLKATINNGETKTSLGGLENGEYPVLWSAGDAIAVIQTKNVEIEGEENTITKIFKFVLQGEGGTTNGVFNLVEYDECGYTVEEFDASAEIKAFYPFEWVVSGAKCNIPTTQTYAENSFGNGASPMAAYRAADNNGALDFQNLFGALKLQIKGMEGEKVQSIEIRSSFNIAGEASFDLEETEGGVQEFVLRVASLDGTSCVTLDCENDNGGVLIQELTNFLIALHPDANWLQIRIKTNEAVYYRTIDRETIITAGTILKMAELENMAPAYIDENDNYLGDGIALPAGGEKTIIWAPVNCGYDDDHKYGLLYQWGRKYGQTYDGETPEVQIIKNTLSDAANGSSEDSKNKYFFGNVSTEDGGIEGVYYWLFPKATDLWNSNTETNPIKTAYDPCPEGWRVPTIAEMETLSEPQGQRDESDDLHRPPMGGSTIYYEGVWSTVGTDNDKHAGLTGCYFYGSTSEKTGSKVFFPAAGYRTFDYYGNSSAELRSLSGNYWSSTTADSNEDHSKIISFYNSGRTRSDSGSRVNGYSVRCVKE